MITSVKPDACAKLPLIGCATSLDSIPVIVSYLKAHSDNIPSSMIAGVTVADICPCSCQAGNLNPKIKNNFFFLNGTGTPRRLNFLLKFYWNFFLKTRGKIFPQLFF